MAETGEPEKRRRCTYEPTEASLLSIFPSKGNDPLDPRVVEPLTRFMRWASVMVKKDIFDKMTNAAAVGQELWGFRMLDGTDGLIDGWLPIVYVLDAVLCYRCAPSRTFGAANGVPECTIVVKPRIVSDAEVQLNVTVTEKDKPPYKFGVSCDLAHWNFFRLTISIFSPSDW